MSLIFRLMQIIGMILWIHSRSHDKDLRVLMQLLRCCQKSCQSTSFLLACCCHLCKQLVVKHSCEIEIDNPWKSIFVTISILKTLSPRMNVFSDLLCTNISVLHPSNFLFWNHQSSYTDTSNISSSQPRSERILVRFRPSLNSYRWSKAFRNLITLNINLDSSYNLNIRFLVLLIFLCRSIIERGPTGLFREN